MFVQATMQFSARVRVNLADAGKSLRIRPCGQGVNVQLGPVDELKEVSCSLG